MAQQTAAPPLLPHDKGDIPLCQPFPLPPQHPQPPLPPPRVRIMRPGVGRRQDLPSLPLPPLPSEFVDVGPALPPSSLCPPTPTHPPPATAVRARVIGVPGGVGHGGGGIQVPAEVPPPPPQVLTGGEGGALVLGGDDLPQCVVLDLQGNVVVQEPPPPHTPAPPHQSAPPAPPYLVDQPILVQVGHGATQTRAGGGAGGNILGSYTEIAQGKRGVERESQVGGGSIKLTNGVTKAEFEPRWSFRGMEVKVDQIPSAPLPPPPPPPPTEDSAGEEEEDHGEEMGRPRRKSAKRARQRWKSISEVEGGRGTGGRSRRPTPAPPRPRIKAKGEDVEEAPVAAGVGIEVATAEAGEDEELPVWARRLSSVRVLEGKWVVGVAATNEVLQETLEAHSRSVLCDYIKSHPSSLEQRHKTKCQASRIMWHHQRVSFDGVPFTILSSNDLKCAFAMNYKLKRKNKGSGENNTEQKGEMIGDFGGGGGGGGGARGGGEDYHHQQHQQQQPTGNNHHHHHSSPPPPPASSEQPKRKYKDIWFTSCPARITVKVIVKYPGFAVSPGALAGERKAVMKALRRELVQGGSPQREELFHVTLPLRRLHNHPLRGHSRGIHPSVDAKVVALLREGITAPKVIQRLLERHVEATMASDPVPPHPEDRAFHPRLKDVANLVYTRCRQLGIATRRRPPDQPPLHAPHRKRRRSRRPRGEDGEGDGEGDGDGDGDGGCDDALGASTLQEAVQTFCTEESEQGSLGEGRDMGRGTAGEVAGLAEMVRGQLDTLRGLTYTLQEVGPLQEVYQGLQGLISQYVAPAGTGTGLGGGALGEVAQPTATFILQDPATVDNLALPPSGPCVAEVPDLTLQDKDGADGTNKPRGTAGLRQLRPPVALQCLTTSMVPTLVSQLPRAPTHAPPPHGVASPAPAPPTYQTLAPVAQDGNPPVHLSLPPYFYYVQEVTVPETSQTWTYSTSS
ncbi:uncharacterized protein LOC126985439 isoform X2 [Eriocheir sinensis]|uniref:uncharacterized protein LOC126985439 isoform X2 n=1 Tax=Eriocheir sinensis TaxID=95602 RepID=UPI0021C5BF9D|nr:uncharacterized protein LOC126985439 isoform X2 [Eriocheir sinensis]